MKRMNYSRLLGGVAGVVMVISSGQAFAQTVPNASTSDGTPDASSVTPPAGATPAPAGATSATAPAAPASSQQAPTQDIIVTAQRRDTSLSKTPVAILVVSGNTLAKAQITSQQELRTVAPGLQIRSSLNSNQINYAIRGQSLDPLSDTTPGVVPYINEVQVGGTAGAAAFYDLANVQVLEGPQGTLFGRSATGGAVLFTTAKPTNEFGGYVSGTYGNYNYGKAEGAINIPLVTDQLLFRAAGIYQRSDGFQHNLYTDGGREGDYKRYGGRASLTANFSDSVHNDLVVDYYQASGSSTVAVAAGLVPFTGTGSPFIPIQALYAGTSNPTASATGIGTVQAFLPPAYAALVPGFYNNYFAPGSGHPATGITQEVADQIARGGYQVDSDANNVYRTKNILVTNGTTIDLGPDTKIKNIFGYGHIRSFNSSDSDGTPYGISQSSTKGGPLAGYNELEEQYSEELQLQGKLFNDRLTYVVGLYYLHQNTTRLINSGFFDILLGGQNQVNNYRLTTRTRAGYGQATYNLNDKGLSITGGIRYTSEVNGKDVLGGDSFRIAAPVAPPGYDYSQSKTYNRISWQGGLQEQLNPSTLFYITGRRAYKSGGFNGTVAPFVGNAAAGGDAYAAERVTDIEVGTKFNGHVANMPVRVNVALFNDWIKDSQRLAFTLAAGNPAALTVNVPKGKTYGAEFDASISPVRWLTVGGTGNYTHATYSSDPVFVNGDSQTFDQVPDTPRVSGDIYADVTVPVKGDIDAVVHGDVYHQTRDFTTPRSSNDAGAIINRYSLVNFRLGVQNDNQGWSLTANLKNALDKRYFVGGLATGEIYQINTLIPGQPRTVSVEARFKF